MSVHAVCMSRMLIHILEHDIIKRTYTIVQASSVWDSWEAMDCMIVDRLGGIIESMRHNKHS